MHIGSQLDGEGGASEAHGEVTNNLDFIVY
jgi:hypothetical protein